MSSVRSAAARMAAAINPTQLAAQLTGEKRKAEAGAVAAHAVIEGLERHASVLNAANQESLSAVLQAGSDAAAVPVRSDADEQLLLCLTMPQAVKLREIKIAGPEDGTAPQTVKLYANKPSMTFDDTEDLPPTQTLELTGPSATLPLQFVKFQCVTSLSVFIENNQSDGETTCLTKLQFVGSTIATTNMSELKKMG